MNDFNFLRPLYFLLLIPFTLILFALWKKKLSGGVWSKLCAKHLQPYILQKKPISQIIPVTLLALTGLFSVIALAGPTWDKITLPLHQKKSGLVIALDLSQAMNTEDIKPSRLQRARYKINDILEKRKEGQTALIVYTDEAFVVTPLTTDIKTISSLIPALETTIMPTQGLRHDRAIAKASALLEQAGITDGSILLITADSQETPFVSNVSVSILGVGTEQGAPITKGGGGFHIDAKGGMVLSKLDKKKLAQLAEATGGRFSALTTDDRDIAYLLKDTDNTSDYEKQESLVSTKPLDGGYWLVLLALPLGALLCRRNSYLTFSLIFLASNLQAFEWNDLWLSSDQRGKQAFDASDYSKAADTFQNESWQAAAYYKSENYAEAAKRYENDHSPDGYYNYGNALAKQGAIDEAIAAYDQALALQPDHEDAAYNKNILEQMKQLQENNQQNQDGKGDKSDGSQENQEGDKDQQEQQGNNSEDKQDQKDKDQEQQDKNQKDQHNEQGKDQQKQEEQQSSKQDEKPEDLSQETKEQYSQKIDEQMQKPDDQTQAQVQESKEGDQQQDIDECWLQRVPDHPEMLLKRKFQYQYRNQQGR